MPFGRVDDGFEGHPKRELVSLAADGLLMNAVSRACRHLTDGFVTEAWVRRQLEREPRRRRPEILRELLEHELLEVLSADHSVTVLAPRLVGVRKHARSVTVGPHPEPGYVIHDFLDYNPAKADVDERRATERDKKAEQRAKARQDALPWDVAGGAVSPGDSLSCPLGSPPLEGTPGRERGEATASLLTATSDARADARAPTPRIPSELEQQVGEVIGVLAQVGRLHIDRVGVENAMASFPSRDAVAAAREVVTWATDPAFRSTNAARLLHKALSDQDLRASRPVGRRSATSTGQRASEQAKQWLDEAERLEAEGAIA